MGDDRCSEWYLRWQSFLYVEHKAQENTLVSIHQREKKSKLPSGIKYVELRINLQESPYEESGHSQFPGNANLLKNDFLQISKQHSKKMSKLFPFYIFLTHIII